MAERPEPSFEVEVDIEKKKGPLSLQEIADLTPPVQDFTFVKRFGLSLKEKMEILQPLIDQPIEEAEA